MNWIELFVGGALFGLIITIMIVNAFEDSREEEDRERVGR